MIMTGTITWIVTVIKLQVTETGLKRVEYCPRK